MSAPESHISTEPTWSPPCCVTSWPTAACNNLRPDLKNDSLGYLSYYPHGKMQGITSRYKPEPHLFVSGSTGRVRLSWQVIKKSWAHLRSSPP